MDNYKIFAELKNKNIKREKIIEILSHISKEIRDITDLKRHNKDLLYFSCFNDNETLFEYLTEHYKDRFQSTYKECIFFTYINRSPKILEIALSSLLPLNTEEKQEYIQRFSLNCYRKENIEVVSKWMNNNFTEEEKTLFITNLYKNNNKPFLEYASIEPSLKSIVLNINLEVEQQIQTQNYLKRYSSQNNHHSISIKKDEIPQELNSSNENQNPIDLNITDNTENNLIVKRKRRLLNKEV